MFRRLTRVTNFGNKCFLTKITRWVQLDYLIFDIIYWSIKDKFIDILNQC